MWDTWHSDPNGVLLVAEVKPSYPDPNKGDLNKAVVSRNTKSRYLNRSKVIGVAHACVCPTRKQLWIEGIRINSKYRRMGIASKLIDRMIEYGREFDSNIREVAAITAKANTASRSMLEKNKFRKRARWEFYTGFKEDNSHQTIMHNSAISMQVFECNESYVPNVPNDDTNNPSINMDVSFASICDIEEIIAFLLRSKTFNSSGRRYVQSWKWYELNLEYSQISELLAKEKIIIVRTSGTQEISGLAITNDYSRQINCVEEIRGKDQGWKKIASEEDASRYDNDVDDDNDNSSFQLVYVDAPTSPSLKNLLVFVLDWVISSCKFDKIQLFVPVRMYHEGSGFYEVTDILTKFGFSKSERFLLYVRNM